MTCLYCDAANAPICSCCLRAVCPTCRANPGHRSDDARGPTCSSCGVHTMRPREFVMLAHQPWCRTCAAEALHLADCHCLACTAVCVACNGTGNTLQPFTSWDGERSMGLTPCDHCHGRGRVKRFAPTDLWHLAQSICVCNACGQTTTTPGGMYQHLIKAHLRIDQEVSI